MTLADHSITAFIGPSGCGKSTLLRVLNRMYALYPNQRAEGEVLHRGPGHSRARRRRRGTALPRRHGVPEGHALSDVGVRQRRLRPASRRRHARAPNWSRRVESALRDAAIWDEVKDKLDDDGRSLSGGQQQRLCIARAIAVQPEVLLLDEPTAALDPISTLRVEETLQALREKYCIVIVTHNLQQAARVSNVTGFMYLGELVEIGPSSEIFTSPKNRKTDDYITGRFG